MKSKGLKIYIKDSQRQKLEKIKQEFKLKSLSSTINRLIELFKPKL